MGPRPSDQPLLAFSLRALRVAMANKDIPSRTVLAKRTGLKSKMHWILGGYIPSVEERQRIADVLGVSVDTIWLPVEAPAPAV